MSSKEKLVTLFGDIISNEKLREIGDLREITKFIRKKNVRT